MLTPLSPLSNKPSGIFSLFLLWITVFLLLILRLPSIHTAGADCSSAEVLLVTSTGNDAGPLTQYTYYTEGVNAALAQNSPRVITRTRSFASLSATFLDDSLAMYPDVVVLLGLMGNPLQLQTQSGTAAEKGYVAIGTVFTGDAYRVWSPTSYLTRTEEVLELAMLLRYCINVLRIARIAVFVYSVDAGGGRQESFLKYYLNAAGYVNGTDWFPVLYTVSLADFSAVKPQGVVCTDFLIKTVQTIRNSAALADLFYFTASYRYGRLLQLMGETPASIPSNFNQQVYTTSTNFIGTDKEYTVIQKFLSDWNATPMANEHLITSDNPYSLMYSVMGWLAGMIAVQVLNLVDVNNLECTHENVQSLLLGEGASHSYVVSEDFLIGGFAGVSTLQSNTGGNCNQGGRAAWMYKTILSSKGEPTLFSSMEYSYANTDSKCYFEDNDAPLSVIVGFLSYTDGPLAASSLALDYVWRVLNVVGSVPHSEDAASIEFYATEYSMTAAGDVATLKGLSTTEKVARVLVGVASVDLSVSVNDTALQVGIVTPSQGTNAVSYTRLRVTVFPSVVTTVWQSLAIPIQTLYPRIEAYHYCVPTDYVSTDISDIDTTITAARDFWSCPASFSVSPSWTALADGETRVNFVTALSLQANKATLLNGAGPGMGDSEAFVTFLSDNPDSYLYMYFQDFALEYQNMYWKFKFAPVSVQQRMYTITNLPQWNDDSTEATDASALLTSFQTVAQRSEWTPLHLIMFTSLHLLGAILPVATDLSPESLAMAIYQQYQFDILGLSLRYSDEACGTSSVGSVECTGQKSDGATSTKFLSMRQIIDPGTSLVSPFEEPPVKGKVMTAFNWALLVIVIVFILARVALVLLLYLYTLFLRRKRYAAVRLLKPEKKRPVTCVVFSFDEAMCRLEAGSGPKEAEKARKMVEKIIRDAIRTHELVETLNTGAAVHAISVNALSAANCCFDVFRSMDELEWMMPESEESDADAVHKKYHGEGFHAKLRVNMGISTSAVLVDKLPEEEVGDYWGNCINEAESIAKELSHGLIVASTSTWFALSKSEGDSMRVYDVIRWKLSNSFDRILERCKMQRTVEYYLLKCPGFFIVEGAFSALTCRTS